MSAHPPVAVAVVSWNTRELLRRCLDSLAAESESGRAQIWVVDNDSHDGSAELVREHYPWVHLLAQGENLGFGRAVNLVADRTDAPWIAPANADVELTPGALAELLAVGEREPGAGAVAPRLMLADGSTQHSVHHFPTLPFTLLFNLGLQRLVPRLGDALCLEGHWDADRERPVDWAIGAFLLLRRSAWNEVGGFASEQWMYAEDLDLGWRLAQAGWMTRYVPTACIAHRAAASTSQRWGGARRARWLEATYAWMDRRRGALVTTTYALLNIAGATARSSLLRPLARLNAERFAQRATSMAEWARLHWRAYRARHLVDRSG